MEAPKDIYFRHQFPSGSEHTNSPLPLFSRWNDWVGAELQPEKTQNQQPKRCRRKDIRVKECWARGGVIDVYPHILL